jgi:hypothetical protein
VRADLDQAEDVHLAGEALRRQLAQPRHAVQQPHLQQHPHWPLVALHISPLTQDSLLLLSAQRQPEDYGQHVCSLFLRRKRPAG